MQTYTYTYIHIYMYSRTRKACWVLDRIVAQKLSLSSWSRVLLVVPYYRHQFTPDLYLIIFSLFLSLSLFTCGSGRKNARFGQRLNVVAC